MTDANQAQQDAVVAFESATVKTLRAENARLRHIAETDPFEDLWHQVEAERDAARAELAVLRAQRDAALEACTEAIHAPMLYAQTHDLVEDVRAALGVQPEPDLASVEEADMQAEHDAEFHGGPV